MSGTLCMKLELRLPNRRATDKQALEATRKKTVKVKGKRTLIKGDLYARLWALQNELAKRMNYAVSVLWSMKQGVIPIPQKLDPKTNMMKDEHQLTLAYQLITGALVVGTQPHDFQFQPAGGVCSASANVVIDRLSTDYLDVMKGLKSIPSFKNQPISVRAKEIKYLGRNLFRFTVFSEGLGIQQTVTFEVVNPGNYQAVIDKIEAEQVKMGTAKIKWEERKRKWILSLPYTVQTAPVENVEEQEKNDEKQKVPLILGIDVGHAHAAYPALVTLDGTVRVRSGGPIDWPSSMIRALVTYNSEYKSVLNSTQVCLKVRAGKGRERKLRPALKIAERRKNLVDQMVITLATQVVSLAKRKGASYLAVEDLKNHYAEDMHNKIENLGISQKEKARARTLVFSRQMMTLLAKIKQIAARESIELVEVPAAYTSKTCHKCGTVWSNAPGVADKKTGVVAQHGRHSQSKFTCSCGYEGNADYNAACNIAIRASKKLSEKGLTSV